ncbi:hypothetical protein C8R43DRAFT_1127011 [Mycena crocata]|nr:hypothetical protein C8R43DRAFT_1127011 [Mycena crocata]
MYQEAQPYDTGAPQAEPAKRKASDDGDEPTKFREWGSLQASKHIAALQTKSEQREQDIARLQERLKTTREELDKSKQASAQFSKRYDELERQIPNLNLEAETAKETINRLRREKDIGHEDLKGQITDLNLEAEAAKETIDRLRREKDIEHEDLKGQITNLNLEAEAAKETIDRLRREKDIGHEDLKGQITNLNLEAEAAKETIDRLRREKDIGHEDLKGQITNLNLEAETAKETINRLRREKDIGHEDLKGQITDLNLEAEAAKETIDRLRREKDIEHEDLKGQITNLNLEAEAAKETIDRLRREKDIGHEDLKGQITNLNLEAEAAKETIDRLRRDTQQVTAKFEDAQRINLLLNGSLAQAQRTQTEWAKTLTVETEAFDRLHKKYEAAKSEAETAQETVDRLRREKDIGHEDLKGQITNLNLEAEAAKETIDRLRREKDIGHEDLKGQITNLNLEAEAAKETIDRLRREKDIGHEDLKGQITNLNLEAEAAKETIDRLRRDTQQVTAKFEDAQRINLLLNGSLAQAQRTQTEWAKTLTVETEAFDRLHKKYEAAKSEAETAQETVDRLRREKDIGHEDLKGQITNLNLEAETAKETIDQLRREKDIGHEDLKDQITNLNLEAETAKETIDRLRREKDIGHEDLKDQITNLNLEAETAKETIDRLRRDTQQVTAKFEDAQRNNLLLNGSLAQAQRTQTEWAKTLTVETEAFDRLHKKYQENKSTLAAADEELQSHQQQRCILEEECHSLEKKRVDILGQWNDLKNDRDCIQTTLSQTQATLLNMRKDHESLTTDKVRVQSEFETTKHDLLTLRGKHEALRASAQQTTHALTILKEAYETLRSTSPVRSESEVSDCVKKLEAELLAKTLEARQQSQHLDSTVHYIRRMNHERDTWKEREKLLQTEIRLLQHKIQSLAQDPDLFDVDMPDGESGGQATGSGPNPPPVHPQQSAGQAPATPSGSGGSNPPQPQAAGQTPSIPAGSGTTPPHAQQSTGQSPNPATFNKPRQRNIIRTKEQTTAQNMFRKMMQKGMGMKKDEDVIGVKDVTDLAQAFQANQGPGPSIKDDPWAPFLGPNAQKSDVHPEQKAVEGVDEDFLRAHFRGRMETLRKTKMSKLKAAADPVGAARAKVVRASNATNNSGRGSLYKLRTDSIAFADASCRDEFQTVMTTATKGCMSSDDEPLPGHATKGCQVKHKTYRAHDLVSLFKWLDANYIANGPKTASGIKLGPMRHTRIRKFLTQSRCSEKIVMGLPENFYSPAWLASLTPAALAHLDMQPSIPLPTYVLTWPTNQKFTPNPDDCDEYWRVPPKAPGASNT